MFQKGLRFGVDDASVGVFAGSGSSHESDDGYTAKLRGAASHRFSLSLLIDFFQS
jgi:hypothetical protein